MDLQDYATVGASVAVLLGAVWTGLQSLQAKRQATRAADNSHPISNGWGTQLREDMAKQTRVLERMEEAQLLAERREVQRDQRLDNLRHALDAHLDAHSA